jgi:hypothetical protein
MKNLQKIKSSLNILSSKEQNGILGGVNQNNGTGGTETVCRIKDSETGPSDNFPCGDYNAEHTFDGDWKDERKDFCRYEAEKCNAVSANFSNSFSFASMSLSTLLPISGSNLSLTI